MKVLLLCAGYGTRFVRDVLASDEALGHRALAFVPKPLLNVNGRPLISHWTQAVSDLDGDDVTEIVVVINELYRDQFEAWREKEAAAGRPNIVLICDGSTSNDTRIGAVACIHLALERRLGYDEPVLIVAGDTLLHESFRLGHFLDEFRRLEARSEGEEASSLIIHCSCADDEVSKRGIIETDGRGKVVSFLEKPRPSETKSRKQAPCFYLLHRDHLSLVGAFLDEVESQPMEAKDAAGHFLRFLIGRGTVHGYKVRKRYDVGGLQSYLDCCEELAST